MLRMPTIAAPTSSRITRLKPAIRTRKMFWCMICRASISGLERQGRYLSHRFYKLNFHLADLLGLQVFAHVDVVFKWQEQLAHTAALGGQHLFFDAAYREHLAGKRDF